MKKFLFTLAALLMAGSLCAEEYFYVEDFEVSKEMLAQTTAAQRRVQKPVYAHFDAYVNSWTVNFGSADGSNTLPAGVTMRADGASGPGMSITYMKNNGSMTTANLEVGVAQSNTRYIGTVGVTGGYWFPEGLDPDEDDPVTYGSIKWEPGDYTGENYMFTVTFQFAQTFTGGDVIIETQPSSGKDERGPITDGVTRTRVLHITVEQDTPPTPEQAVTPTITVTGQYAQTVTIAGEEGATLYYSLDNETWTEYTAPFVLDVPGEYTVYAYAVGPNDKTESEHASQAVTVTEEPAGQADAPVITISNDNTTEVGISISAEAGAQIYYEITEAGAKAYTEYTESFTYTTPGTYTIDAYAVGPNGKTESAHDTKQFTVKAPDQPSTPGDITYEVTPTGYLVTPTGPNAQIMVNGEAVDVPYFVERPAYGQEDANVVIYVRTDEGEGYYPVTTEVSLTVKAQLPTPENVITPGQASADWVDGQGYTNIVDGHYVDVTFNAPEGYEVHYVINGPNGAHWEGVYDGTPIHITANGAYTVESWTQVGDDMSPSDVDPFVIDVNTSVDELINGKTVASKRFFNMAGQEMQEVNGVTIVVTTYTDGTTTATKVMK